VADRDYNAELAQLLHEATHPWRGCTPGERNKLFKKFERALLAAPTDDLGEELRAAQLMLKRDLGMLPRTEVTEAGADPSELTAYVMEQVAEFANKLVSEVLRQGVILPYSPLALHARIMLVTSNIEKEFLHDAIPDVLNIVNGPGGLERLEQRVRELGYVPAEGEVLPGWCWQQQ
jgi:hypothetical protein